MANQRQSSDRGCTQRGANRRNTLLRTSQLAIFLVASAVCLAPANLRAQITVTNSLRVVAQNIPSNICSDTSSTVTFTVEGNGTITPATEQPNAAVYAVPITSGTSCPSGIDQGILAADVELSWTSGLSTFVPLEPSRVYSRTVQDLGFCSQITSKPNWALCVYAWGASNKAGTIKPGTLPIVIAGSLSGGGSTTATAPVIKELVAGDGQISFTATTNKNDTSFEFCYVELFSPLSDAGVAARKKELEDAKTCSGGNLRTRQVTGPNVVVDNLENDVGYYFKVGATNGNLWSAVQGPVTPSKAYSTLELYDGVPGGTSWKCDQGQGRFSPSSLLALLGFLATVFLLSSRRRGQVRRIFASFGIVAFFVLAALPAQADLGQLNLGLFGGPYKPSLDANTTFKTYKCLYADAVLPMLGGELDVHLGDPFGSFQFGTAIGYSWANGKALKTFNASDTNCESQVFSEASVSLHMLQIRPRLSYVFDPYVEDFPFVPFVRAGLVGGGYYFTYQGKADTRGQDKDINPLGMRFGWEASFGLMFLLDVIEQSVADRARGAGTYDHSYLKAEISYQSIDDFGNPGPNFSPASIVGAPANFLGTLALVIQFQ